MCSSDLRARAPPHREGAMVVEVIEQRAVWAAGAVRAEYRGTRVIPWWRPHVSESAQLRSDTPRTDDDDRSGRFEGKCAADVLQEHCPGGPYFPDDLVVVGLDVNMLEDGRDAIDNDRLFTFGEVLILTKEVP